jgi:hypothetical protein
MSTGFSLIVCPTLCSSPPEYNYSRESEFLSILARARALSLPLSLSVSVRVCLVRGSCLLSPRSSAGGLVDLVCTVPTYLPTYLLTYLPYEGGLVSCTYLPTYLLTYLPYEGGLVSCTYLPSEVGLCHQNLIPTYLVKEALWSVPTYLVKGCTVSRT